MCHYLTQTALLLLPVTATTTASLSLSLMMLDLLNLFPPSSTVSFLDTELALNVLWVERQFDHLNMVISESRHSYGTYVN